MTSGRRSNRNREKYARSIDGVLLLDKAEGVSSNRALQQIRKLFGARKAGHTGSLDPLASGMLPVLFGRATRLSGFLLDADKKYVTRALLGQSTTTGDGEGEVLETRSVPTLTEEGIRAVLNGFSGEIDQVPPMYSALKHEGRRLYKLARRGVEVEREPRRVMIYDIRLTGMGPTHLDLEVCCSKGTYIRTLVEDIARALGTVGRVGMLRRVGVGELPVAAMISEADLVRIAEVDPESLDRYILPIDTIVRHLPQVELADEGVSDIVHGRIARAGDCGANGQVRLYAADGRFIGIGEGRPGLGIAPLKVFGGDVDAPGAGG